MRPRRNGTHQKWNRDAAPAPHASRRRLLAAARIGAIATVVLPVAPARADSTVDIAAILREAAKAAGTLGHEERRATLLSRIAFVQGRAGDTAGALATAREALAAPAAQKPEAEGMQALATLVAVQVRAGDRAGAMQTLERLMNGMPGDRREPVATIVAGAQASVGDIPGALATAGGSPVALARVAAIQAGAGDRVGALATAGRARAAAAAGPGGPSSTDLAFIAAVQARAGDRRAAETAFAEAVRLATGPDGGPAPPLAFLRDLQSLEQIARAQILVGHGTGAARTLHAALPLARQHPDDTLRASHLTSVARALAEAGDKTSALTVLREARGIAEKRPGRQDALWLELAEAHVATGNVKEALSIAEGLVAPTGHPELLARVGAIQARAGRKAAAEASFRDALQAASRPPVGGDRMVLRRLARLQAEVGDAKATAAWAAALAEPAVRAEVLLAAAEGLLARQGTRLCEFPSSTLGC
jgi:tetratricopeptide (TPR) repeat protein